MMQATNVGNFGRRCQRVAVKDVLAFVDTFRNDSPTKSRTTHGIAFRVYLVSKVTTKPTSGDVAVEFIP